MQITSSTVIIARRLRDPSIRKNQRSHVRSLTLPSNLRSCYCSPPRGPSRTFCKSMAKATPTTCPHRQLAHLREHLQYNATATGGGLVFSISSACAFTGLCIFLVHYLLGLHRHMDHVGVLSLESAVCLTLASSLDVVCRVL